MIALQILFISGLSCIIGLQRTFFFFFQRHKVKATVAFFGGIFIVLIGWPMIGMVAEIYGFLLLFRYVSGAFHEIIPSVTTKGSHVVADDNNYGSTAPACPKPIAVGLQFNSGVSAIN
jgi:hypothetical protein